MSMTWRQHQAQGQFFVERDRVNFRAVSSAALANALIA